jgi:Trk K+ transport system NAD-binding subunit
VEVVVAGHSPLAGKTLMDLALPIDTVVTSIRRNGSTFIPRGLTRLEPGDRLALLVANARRGAILSLLGDDDLLSELPRPATITGSEPAT